MRPFDYVRMPTLRAEVDGIEVFTVGPALAVEPHPIPVYVPDEDAVGFVDPGAEWKVVGDFGGEDTRGMDQRPHGYHIPDSRKHEIQDWVNEFCAANPNKPMIVRWCWSGGKIYTEKFSYNQYIEVLSNDANYRKYVLGSSRGASRGFGGGTDDNGTHRRTKGAARKGSRRVPGSGTAGGTTLFR